jgi:hypothetical protein
MAQGSSNVDKNLISGTLLEVSMIFVGLLALAAVFFFVDGTVFTVKWVVLLGYVAGAFVAGLLSGEFLGIKTSESSGARSIWDVARSRAIQLLTVATLFYLSALVAVFADTQAISATPSPPAISATPGIPDTTDTFTFVVPASPPIGVPPATPSPVTPASAETTFSAKIAKEFKGLQECLSVLQRFLKGVDLSTCPAGAPKNGEKNNELNVFLAVLGLFVFGFLLALAGRVWELLDSARPAPLRGDLLTPLVTIAYSTIAGMFYALHWFAQDTWITATSRTDPLLLLAVAWAATALLMWRGHALGTQTSVYIKSHAGSGIARLIILAIVAGLVAAFVAVLILPALRSDTRLLLIILAIPAAWALWLLIVYVLRRLTWRIIRLMLLAVTAALAIWIYLARCEIFTPNGGPIFASIRESLEDSKFCLCTEDLPEGPQRVETLQKAFGNRYDACRIYSAMNGANAAVCKQNRTRWVAENRCDANMEFIDGRCGCRADLAPIEGQCGCAPPPPRCEATISFDPGRDQPRDAADISKALQTFRQPHCQDKTIAIEGSGDAGGGDYWDCELSKRRAASIYREFQEAFGPGRVIVNRSAAVICHKPPPPPCDDPCAPSPCADPCAPPDDGSLPTEVPGGVNDWIEKPPPGPPGVVEVTGVDSPR